MEACLRFFRLHILACIYISIYVGTPTTNIKFSNRFLKIKFKTLRAL